MLLQCSCDAVSAGPGDLGWNVRIFALHVKWQFLLCEQPIALLLHTVLHEVALVFADPVQVRAFEKLLATVLAVLQTLGERLALLIPVLLAAPGHKKQAKGERNK